MFSTVPYNCHLKAVRSTGGKFQSSTPSVTLDTNLKHYTVGKDGTMRDLLGGLGTLCISKNECNCRSITQARHTRPAGC